MNINESDSFSEIFKKVTGKSYNKYLKRLEKIKEKAEYEKIPQQTFILKK